MKSWLTRAREASGLDPEQCARVLCRSAESYRALEAHPGCMSIDELRALLTILSAEGTAIVHTALLDLLNNTPNAR